MIRKSYREGIVLKNKRAGFTSLECVISMSVLVLIIYAVTFSLNNGLSILKKTYVQNEMLLILKEAVESERNIIKSSTNLDSDSSSKKVDAYVIKTIVKKTDYSRCYYLNVNVESDLSTMEINTYVGQS